MWQKVIKVLNLGNSSRGIKLCLKCLPFRSWWDNLLKTTDVSFIVKEGMGKIWGISSGDNQFQISWEPLQWALDILFVAKTADRQTGSVLTLPFLESDAAAKQLLLNKRFLNMYRVSSTNLENKLKATRLWKKYFPLFLLPPPYISAPLPPGVMVWCSFYKMVC